MVGSLFVVCLLVCLFTHKARFLFVVFVCLIAWLIGSCIACVFVCVFVCLFM